jgi:hypothetical protein
MTHKTELTSEDIMDVESYNTVRQQRRAMIVEKKKLRRVSLGPYATFYFESFETMWYQVQEMLRIEKGGDDQLKDELAAYNPLIPQGNELVATVMFEIDNPDIRAAFLGSLGGVENQITMEFEDEVILAIPEQDLDRTNSAGKASSVQFVHFNFSQDQITKFTKNNASISVCIKHPKYNHTTVLSHETLQALADDFL